jgi:RNA polymerase sigma factor (sigma-70 family)
MSPLQTHPAPPLTATMATALPADAELVSRALAGDAAAFEAIMRRHNRLLFRSARGVVGDDAEAQDVVQEAYLRAFTTLRSFRGDAALGTWLARIAINIALDVQRRQRHTAQTSHEGGHGAGPSGGEHASETAMHVNAAGTPGPDTPDTAAERSQMRALLQGAIDGLPPIYRSVFILRAIEEMSVDETASCLQVSGDVVKTRYLRARGMLRDALGARIEAHAPDTYAFAGSRCDAVVAHVLAHMPTRLAHSTQPPDHPDHHPNQAPPDLPG